MPVHEKYQIIYDCINKENNHLKVSDLCSSLNVSRSGYYSFVYRLKHPTSKSIQDFEDFKLIKEAYDYKNRHKGARQIKMVLLNTFGINMNLKKIRRLMKKFDLVCPIRKANPYRRMAKAMKTNNYAFNKINRNFKTDKVGEHLLTDITYVYYGKEKKLCYCSTIKDASTNEILSLEVSKTLELPFVLKTVENLKEIPFIDLNKAVLHSDQGCHYTSVRFVELLNSLNLSRSMSRRGNCWDNAPQESFFGHMKDELHLSECSCFEEVVEEFKDYFDYYNNHRPQWGLERLTPVQYRNKLLDKPCTALAIIYEEMRLF